jgi:hypothetical protein
MFCMAGRPLQLSNSPTVEGHRPNSQSGVAFDELAEADLVLDEYYFGGRARNLSDEVIARLLPVGNQGGFRHNGTLSKGNVRLVVLFSTGRDTDWPDNLDQRNGIFTYYGDNKTPGHDLHDTQRGGNVLLRDTFARSYGDTSDRRVVPPFFLFTSTGNHRDVRFRGLLAPGSVSSSSDDDLQAVWRSKDGLRFQNYRARFTVLDEPRISRGWIKEVLAGTPLGPSCPTAWRQWVLGRAYRPLLAEPTTIGREPRGASAR